MPRKPRVRFAGAIYQVVAKGDGRQTLFHDPGHYERLTQGLADEVLRWGFAGFAGLRAIQFLSVS